MAAELQRRGRRRGQLMWAIPAVVVALFVVVLPHLDVLAGGVVPVAQALLPAGAVGLLFLALIPLIARRWVAAVILVLGAVLSSIPALTPLRAVSECAESTPLTVLSFNAKFARADPAQLVERIRSSGADVVVLVETDETLIDAVLNVEGLGSALPYRTREVSAGAVNGSVILSAFSLRDEEDIPGSVFDQVSAVAALPGGGEVRLAAVHPPSPVGQPMDWHDAISDIDSWIREASDTRLVIAGDLNSSYAHPVFRELTSSLRNAAEAAGPIPWPTWPQEKPVPAFTAIDHVLARGAVPTGWESFYIEGSDHRGVVGDWLLCAP